jgi:Ca-activated chloride channel family protein
MMIEQRTLAVGVELAAACAALVGAWLHARRSRHRAGQLTAGSWRWTPRPPGVVRRPVSAWLGAIAAGCLAASVAAAIGRATPALETSRAKVIVLAVDVSQSMLAGDVKPTRLDVARARLIDLVRGARGYSFGVIAFAGDSSAFLPVTPDSESVVASLKQIGPGSAATPGSSLGQGLALALETARVNQGQDVVLASDGEATQDDDLVSSTLKRAAELGIRIHAIAVGTTSGSTVPLDVNGGAPGIKTYPDGRPVVTRAEPARLQAIASATSGFLTVSDESHTDTQGLARAIENPVGARGKGLSLEHVLLLMGAFILMIDALGVARR